jgi:hypothetical protein
MNGVKVRFEELTPNPQPGEAWLRAYVKAGNLPEITIELNWVEANFIHGDLEALIMKRAGT